MERQIRKLASLKHGIEYLEDAVRQYAELYKMLLDRGLEVDVDKLLAQKRAENSLAAGIGCLERVKKEAHHG